MEFNIPVDLIGKQEMMVAAKDTAAQYGSGLIEVFATPAMVGFMEGTAQLSLQSNLPKGFITLGIEINVKHLKATPVGMKVFCESKLSMLMERSLLLKLQHGMKKAILEPPCIIVIL